MKPRRRLLAVGQMSGTSRDGLDTVVLEIRGRFPNNTIRMLHAETYPYRPAVRRYLGLDASLDPGTFSARRLSRMHFDLGRFYALMAERAIRHAGLSLEDIDVIGCHGQTIYHRPSWQFRRHWAEDLPRDGSSVRSLVIEVPETPSTLQAGSGAVIAAITGITAVTDFRSGDVAVGGEGAPLVPIYDYVALRSPTKSRVALNIGGIANLTAIPKRSPVGAILSFDTGPGNCVIDTAMRLLTRGRLGFDRDGAWAKRGSADPGALRAMLRHRYLRRLPPKSTGWEEFGLPYTSRIVEQLEHKRVDKHSIIRTVSEAVAESIARSIEQFVRPKMAVDEVIVTGGGANNLFLMEVLKRRLAPARVDRGEAFGVDSRYKEACAFAYLAYLRLKGIPANVASQRQGLQAVVLGAVYPGRPRRPLVKRPRT